MTLAVRGRVSPRGDRSPRLGIESFSRAVGLHPELVRRLVTLGLLEASDGPSGELWFAPTEVAAARRIQRLRAGLCLNYAALGVVVQLLDRINELEATIRKQSRTIGEPPWTSTG